MDSGLEIDYGTKKSFRRRLTDGCEPDSNTIFARSFSLKELNFIRCSKTSKPWCKYLPCFDQIVFLHITIHRQILIHAVNKYLSFLCVLSVLNFKVFIRSSLPVAMYPCFFFETLQISLDLQRIGTYVGNALNEVEAQFSGKYGWFCWNIGGTCTFLAEVSATLAYLPLSPSVNAWEVHLCLRCRLCILTVVAFSSHKCTFSVKF